MPRNAVLPGGLTAAVAALALGGCAGPHAGMDHSRMMGGPMAMAVLEPTRGQGASGRVMFHQMGEDQVMVHAMVKGLKPNAEHGFHIHDKGDCSSGDGMSAGGHFNPGGHPHGGQAGPRHAGDMPNLRSNANGEADMRFTLSGVSIGRGAADIVGRGLIVHAEPDDYRTQPTGNSGARIACGVIVQHTR
ncbi:superoxide dismutase family protein [Caldimonas taiwanensis]|uniref:superoxide dismutase family protein n=1 Tax=Caldimonas taiwanensis TaxID=307483 RepID=UPI000783B627